MELKIFNFEIIRYGSLVCMCTPLVKILIQSLKERFQKVLSNSDYAITTSLHPQFRLSMMTIEDENDEDSFVYKGMQQTVKAKVVNLLREKLEAQEQQDVSDGGSDMDENEHSDILFDFLFKGSNDTCRDSAVKIFERFVDQKPQRQICSSNFQNNALKNLFIRYNTALPSSAAVERVFSVGKDILKPKRAGLSEDHFEMLIFLKVNGCS